jgi:hypothetical protein
MAPLSATSKGSRQVGPKQIYTQGFYFNSGIYIDKSHYKVFHKKLTQLVLCLKYLVCPWNSIALHTIHFRQIGQLSDIEL